MHAKKNNVRQVFLDYHTYHGNNRYGLIRIHSWATTCTAACAMKGEIVAIADQESKLQANDYMWTLHALDKP